MKVKEMGIFLDTGFFIGLVDPTDTYYDKSAELLKIIQTGIYGQIFTSSYVISETLTLAAVRTRNNTMVLNKLNDFLKGDLRIASIYHSNETVEENSIRLFLKLNCNSKKRTISFVDCSNIEFCKEHLIKNILAYDKHFDAWLTRIS